MSAYPGELGWAFVAGGMLLDFDRGPQARDASASTRPTTDEPM